MEELANKLAELQAEHKANIKDMGEDRFIGECETEIEDLKKQLSEEYDTLYELKAEYGQEDLEKRIDATKDQIIDEWDGTTKTRRYPSGVLSFRTTKRLNIIDEVRLVGLLIEKAPIFDVVSKYIKGFKLTDVKKFVEVHNVQTGVAQIESKTSVSLKTE